MHLNVAIIKLRYLKYNGPNTVVMRVMIMDHILEGLTLKLYLKSDTVVVGVMVADYFWRVHLVSMVGHHYEI